MDDPFGAAGQGVYGLTLAELALLIAAIREWSEQHGGYPSPTQLRVLLRAPGR